MRNIVVYGLGSLGEKIARELIAREEAYKFHIVAFVDKQYLDKDSKFEIVSPECLKELDYDYVLITSEKWFSEIADELVHTYGVNKECIIHLNQLIEEENEYCNLCKAKVPFMLDAGIDSPVFIEKKIVGGGKREKCICPLCGSNDRERWLHHVLFQEVQMNDREATLLHFAPEKQIEKTLRRNEKLTYITADIEEGRADRVEDITNISFPDESFDFIICNHVLEHIVDEEKAFSELKRCINKSGKVIFSVPICWEIDTFEDESVITKEDRLREYGQEDHVRLYGKDIKARLEHYGFFIECYRVDDILTEEQIKIMRLIAEDTIWLLMKKC